MRILLALLLTLPTFGQTIEIHLPAIGKRKPSTASPQQTQTQDKRQDAPRQSAPPSQPKRNEPDVRVPFAELPGNDFVRKDLAEGKFDPNGLVPLLSTVEHGGMFGSRMNTAPAVEDFMKKPEGMLFIRIQPKDWGTPVYLGLIMKDANGLAAAFMQDPRQVRPCKTLVKFSQSSTISPDDVDQRMHKYGECGFYDGLR
jgi:hypothetical protein